jgi:DNA-binding NarL/FixJ family response regulator
MSAGLSPRQREVAALVAEGLSNQQIAERLFISLGTVRTHMYQIFQLTGVRNRTELALYHVRNREAR